MNKTLIIIGVVVLVIGIITGTLTTTQSHLFGLLSTSSTPYAVYMIPLLIGGVILILVGALTGNKR